MHLLELLLPPTARLSTAVDPSSANSDPQLHEVIQNLTNWLTGFLVGLATLCVTIGGFRYLVAAGDPGEIEKAKSSLRSAAYGYALAAMAPVIVAAFASIVAVSR
jgi:hypothetical protein